MESDVTHAGVLGSGRSMLQRESVDIGFSDQSRKVARPTGLLMVRHVATWTVVTIEEEGGGTTSP